MIKKTGRYLYNILMVLVCLILLINVWQLAAQRFLHMDIPSVLGYSYLTVLSGSMEPEFSAGDVLVIHKEEHYAKGDVIAFYEDGMLISHRIIDEGQEGFITKGDANNVPDDELVMPEQIAGKMVLSIPGLGKVILFLRTPLGMILFVLLGIAMVMLPERIGRNNKNGEGGAK